METRTELYKELCAELQKISQHFGRMAFQLPGYVTAVLHDTAPQLDELSGALQQLDQAGAFRTFINTAPEDAAQQEAAAQSVLQALADQRASDPDLNGCLQALGEALQWHGTEWKAVLGAPAQEPLAEEPAKAPEKAAESPAEESEKAADPSGPDFRAGGNVRFGCYPMGENGEVEPIEWKVMNPEFKEDQAMLISRDILDARAFWGKDLNTRWQSIWWEDSPLAEWLNDTFLDMAFTEEEQEAIVPKRAILDLWWEARSDEDEDDIQWKVNLAHQYDIEEFQEKYPELAPEILPAKVTPYAYAQGAYRDKENGNGIWRLIGYGGCRPERPDNDSWPLDDDNSDFASRLNQTVNPDGTLDLYGDSVCADYVGVRPVIVVKKSSLAAMQDEQ